MKYQTWSVGGKEGEEVQEGGYFLSSGTEFCCRRQGAGEQTLLRYIYIFNILQQDHGMNSKEHILNSKKLDIMSRHFIAMNENV